MANTSSSLIWRGWVIFLIWNHFFIWIIFLDFVSMEKVFEFFKVADFSKLLTFYLQIKVFANINWFFHQIWKILVSTESSSEMGAKRCKQIFCSSSGSRDIREKRKVEKQGDVFFFITNCMSRQDWGKIPAKNLPFQSAMEKMMKKQCPPILKDYSGILMTRNTAQIAIWHLLIGKSMFEKVFNGILTNIFW